MPQQYNTGLIKNIFGEQHLTEALNSEKRYNCGTGAFRQLGAGQCVAESIYCACDHV